MSENRPREVHSRGAVHSPTEPVRKGSPRTDDEQPVGQYVEAPSPVPVRVLIGGRMMPGHVLGSRSDRVYVRYRSAEGSHLCWVPAAHVKRVPAAD